MEKQHMRERYALETLISLHRKHSENDIIRNAVRVMKEMIVELGKYKSYEIELKEKINKLETECIFIKKQYDKKQHHLECVKREEKKDDTINLKNQRITQLVLDKKELTKELRDIKIKLNKYENQ